MPPLAALPLLARPGFGELILILFALALVATPAILIPVLVLRARRRRSNRSDRSDRSV